MPFIITNGSSYCHKTRTQAVEIVNDNASATRFSSRASAEKLLQRATKKLKGFEILELQSESRVSLSPKKAEKPASKKAEKSAVSKEEKPVVPKDEKPAVPKEEKPASKKAENSDAPVKSTAPDEEAGSPVREQTSSSKRRRGRPKKDTPVQDTQTAAPVETAKMPEPDPVPTKEPQTQTASAAPASDKQSGKETAQPQPAKENTQPQPVKENAAPQPVKETAQPQPAKESAAPQPVKESAAPQPVKETKSAPVRRKSFIPVVRDIQAASASLWGDVPIVQPSLKKNRAAVETPAAAAPSVEEHSAKQHVEKTSEERPAKQHAEKSREERSARQHAEKSQEERSAKQQAEKPQEERSAKKYAEKVQEEPTRVNDRSEETPDEAYSNRTAADSQHAEDAPAAPAAAAEEVREVSPAPAAQDIFAERPVEVSRHRFEPMKETSERRSNRRRSNHRGQASRNMDSAATEANPSGAEDIFSSDQLPQGKSSYAAPSREDSETRQGTGKIRSTGKRIGKVSGNIHSPKSDNESSQSKRRFFTTKERNMIYNRSEGHCGICGRFIPLEEYTIDHIIPLSKGGTNDLDNLQACCGFCNKAKDDSMGEEFFDRIQRIFLYQAKLRYGKKQFKQLKKTLKDLD